MVISKMHTWWLFIVIVLLDNTWHTLSSEIPDEIETNLRSLFGFYNHPKVDKTKIVIPQAMMEMYHKQMGYPLDTTAIPRPGIHAKSANTVRSFIHIESPTDRKFPTHHRFRLKFDISNVPSNERLTAAELTISRETVKWINGNLDEHFQRIIANDIIRPGIKGKIEAITRPIDSKLVDTRKSGALSLDVFEAVNRWLHNPSLNYGIIVTIMGHGKNKTTPARHLRLKRDLNEDDAGWRTIQPLLITYTDDGRHKQRTGEALTQMRRRRATKKRGRKEKETCRRHVMYVDFRDVGWSDWIVAPPGYDAYYCHGECKFPLAQHLNTTNHAIIQTFVNSMSPGKVPKACCVPTALNSISMLYLDDENKVVLKNYKEMMVDGCGCR